MVGASSVQEERSQEKGNLIVGIHVDALVITRGSIIVINQFKSQMNKLFSMSSKNITLSYFAYSTNVLNICDIKDCNPTHIAMEPRLKFIKESTSPSVDMTLYRSIFESLRYHTFPDLTFSIVMVNRYTEKPTTEHMVAVQHILRYLKGYLNFERVTRRRKETWY